MTLYFPPRADAAALASSGSIIRVRIVLRIDGRSVASRVVPAMGLTMARLHRQSVDAGGICPHWFA